MLPPCVALYAGLHVFWILSKSHRVLPSRSSSHLHRSSSLTPLTCFFRELSEGRSTECLPERLLMPNCSRTQVTGLKLLDFLRPECFLEGSFNFHSSSYLVYRFSYSQLASWLSMSDSERLSLRYFEKRILFDYSRLFLISLPQLSSEACLCDKFETCPYLNFISSSTWP